MKRQINKYMLLISILAATLSALAMYFFMGAGADGYAALSRALVACALICIGVYIIGSLLADQMLDKISDDPDARPDFRELTPLYRRLDEQSRRLKEYRELLEDRQNKLRAITDNMTEGLVLLDGAGVVMLMNRAAERLLGVPEGSFSGKHLFALNQDNLLQAVIHSALGGLSAHENITMGGLRLRAIANPVIVDGAAHGAVLMLIDMTVPQAAEDMRREFSANVSHELKTPITTISGYAEMMTSGMVKPADVSGVAGKIYSEAQRLIDLIDDIIKLSRLDENSMEGQRTEVGLLSTAQSCAGRLEEKAGRYQVSISVEGGEAAVQGNQQLIDEMISNLCDNAIKYNRPGGHVKVTTGRRGEAPFVTVEDDGIGIAPEHIERVFERFYCVDNSRSKDTGGTGLGLSIVKHAAAWHEASIEAESAPERGTRISIVFDGKGEK